MTRSRVGQRGNDNNPSSHSCNVCSILFFFPGSQECIGIYETLLVHVCALHRLEPNWTYDDYTITMQVYHGTTPIQFSDSKVTSDTGKSESFYEWVKFDSW